MDTILIVEDNPFLNELYSIMLGRLGYRSIAAHSREECLGILKDIRPDLILLDVMVNSTECWETLKQIKNNPNTKDIPVIMLVKKQPTPEEIHKYKMYIQDYLLLPTTHRELYIKIEHVLHNILESEISWDNKILSMTNVDEVSDQYNTYLQSLKEIKKWPTDLTTFPVVTCIRCGYAWDITYVQKYMTERQRMDMAMGRGCPKCRGRIEYQEKLIRSIYNPSKEISQ